MKITAINIYPVKSLGGISLAEALAESRGLAYDRRWMLTDREGVFLSQRELPEMARLHPALDNDHLIIRHAAEAVEPLMVPLNPSSYGAYRKVTVWDSVCDAVHVSEEADSWFRKVLRAECQLVYMPDDSMRRPDPMYAKPDDIVSFADGFPFLIVGESSLEFLNNKLETPVSMNRFRPNFVFSGGLPYEEDRWRHFTIGAVHFRGVKTCGRCQIITIDQETLAQGKEPLATLAKYRNFANKVKFGMNLCLESAPGIIRVGEELLVLEQTV